MRRAALSQPALHPLGAPSRECLDWAVFSPGGPRLVVEETLSLCCLSDLDPPLRARPSPRGAAVLGRSFVTMTRTARLRCVATPSRPGTVGKECTQYRITLPPGRGGVWHSPFVPVAAYSLAAQLKLVHLLFLAESDSISSAYACGLALGARAAGELEGP